MIDLAAIAIGMHIGTWHMKHDHGMRDFNPGIYARADRWQAGVYHNSERATSAYVSYAIPVARRLSLNVGFVTGYQYAKVAPAAVLVYSFDNGLRLAAIPHTPKSTGGLHIAYEGERK